MSLIFLMKCKIWNTENGILIISGPPRTRFPTQCLVNRLFPSHSHLMKMLSNLCLTKNTRVGRHNIECKDLTLLPVSQLYSAFFWSQVWSKALRRFTARPQRSHQKSTVHNSSNIMTDRDQETHFWCLLDPWRLINYQHVNPNMANRWYFVRDTMVNICRCV